jgi:sirohydrochlorin ferrochelatase
MTPLVLAAHGSTDQRFADVITSLSATVGTARPDLDVRIGYLEHGPPSFDDIVDARCVVVPVLLTNGYHAHIDIPSRARGALITPPTGPDRRLAVVMARQLRVAGWRGEPVVLAAAGSADEQALDDARTAAADLSAELGVPVTTAFIGSGEPRLGDLSAQAVAPYLIAPGKFADIAAASGAPVVAAPLGADPLIAQIILDRYHQALPSLTLKALSGHLTAFNV